MPLTTQQQEAVRVLDWLLSPEHRRTGRSLAITVALVRRAARHPGTTVRYGDLPFEVTRNNWQHTTIGNVQALIAGDPMLSPHVTYHPEHFRLNLSVGVSDWWPSDSFMAQAEPPAEAYVMVDAAISPPAGEPNANGDIFDLSQEATYFQERVLQRLQTPPGHAPFGSMAHSVDELVQHSQNMGLPLTPEEAEHLIRGPGGERLATPEGQAAMRDRGARPMVMLPPAESMRAAPTAHAENRQVQALRSRTTEPAPTRPNRYDLLAGDEAVEQVLNDHEGEPQQRAQ